MRPPAGAGGSVVGVEVRERIRAAQYRALRVVNTELVGLYWDIGRLIVERQAGDSLGKSIVQQLAGDPQRKFSGIGGFSASNLWRMKSFLRHMPALKTRTTGARNWLESQSGYPGA